MPDARHRAAPDQARVLQLVDAGILAATALLVGLVAGGVTGGARVALALVFVLLAPGWSGTRLVTAVDLNTRLVLSVAISVSVCISVTAAGLWVHWWHPIVMFYALAAASAGSLLLQVRVGRGRRRR